jgi:hypothetical protein
MIFIVLFILLCSVFLDIRLLRKQNSGLFDQTFLPARSYFLAGSGIFLILVLGSEGMHQALLVFSFVFLLPFYLIRRARYLSRYEGATHAFHLACDAFGVILTWLFGGVVISTLVGAYFRFMLEFD